jgi:hypothetical protein
LFVLVFETIITKHCKLDTLEAQILISHCFEAGKFKIMVPVWLSLLRAMVQVVDC